MKKMISFSDGRLDMALSEDIFLTSLIEKESILWLDIQHPDERDYNFLVQELNYHPLAVEDCRDEVIRPKMEDYGDFLFFVFRGINYYSGSHALDTLGIKIFYTKRLLVTVHQKNSKTIEEVFDRLQKNPELMVTTERLFFTILDRLTDNILPVVKHIEDRLENFQHHIFTKFVPSILEETFELKKWVLRLKRFIYPQMKIITQLLATDHPFFSGEMIYQLRDVLDHTQEVFDHLEIYEELFPDAMNSYLSQVTNRMNVVMKTMSIIATLMLPLSFITGIFGMNFVEMPLVHSRGGFWLVIGLMAIIFGSMIVFFRKKDWF